MKPITYPHLQAFLSGWFHQDFDIEGDSIDAIVAEYKRVSPDIEARLVVADIRAFLSNSEDRVDELFFLQFELDIDPVAFAPSVTRFLMQISDQLATAWHSD
jgi:hypothetical protein